jgi:hypothetical protein
VKVGELIQLRREKRERDTLPVGIIIRQKIEAEFEKMPGYFWNEILWGDGTVSGAWGHELRKVT